MIVRISDDALARALGADELAQAFARKGHDVHRTSSWGMHWLEPLVEIDGTGFGPATLADVDAILDGSSPKSDEPSRIASTSSTVAGPNPLPSISTSGSSQCMPQLEVR